MSPKTKATTKRAARKTTTRKKAARKTATRKAARSSLAKVKARVDKHAENAALDANWWPGKTGPKPQHGETKVMAAYKLTPTLLGHLKAHAKTRGVSMTSIVERAIEKSLGVKS